jgi:HEAT repeat protein
MTETRIHRRIVRNRKKSCVPLSKLRTSDAVRTVVAHPRRLEELLKMLEDKDLFVRERAAAALTRLSESHPARLQRAATRIKDSLADDSAYVRWNLLFVLGKLGFRFPSQSKNFLSDLIAKLEDGNRICRMMAGQAIAQVHGRDSQIVERAFQSLKKEIPAFLAHARHKV